MSVNGTFSFGAPPPRPVDTRLKVVAAAAAVVFVASLAAIPLVPRHRQSFPKAWDPRVADIAQFVEGERGHVFHHPVAVEFLSDAAFKKKVGGSAAPSASEKQQLADAVSELRALGLAHGDLDLHSLATELVETDVIGLYVPEKKRVFVRGTDLNVNVRVTLAHELTHALQDQYFDLVKLNKVPGSDDTAVRSLVEGDAVQVERAYVRSLTKDEQQVYENASKADQATPQPPGIPDVLVHQFAFPYAFGPTFVRALKVGGTAAVDTAFRHPPTSEWQILNPDAYLSHVRSSPVATPKVPKGADVVDPPSEFGEETMLEVLGERVGYEPAWNAVAGWRGDRSVAFRENNRVCVAVSTVVDRPESAALLEDVAKKWAAAVPGATAARNGLAVDMKSCDPGAKAPELAGADPSPFDVLVLRTQVVESLIDAGIVSATRSACIADSMIDTVGPARMAELNDDPTAVSPVELRDAGLKARRACPGS